MDKMIPPAPCKLSPEGGPAPRVLCEACNGTIDNLGVGHTTRCPHCGRSLTVPSHVRVECERCAHGHHIRPREINCRRVCAKCGQALLVTDLILTVRRRRVRRTRYQHHHHRSGSAYADAAWAVLILGLTLMISILALTVL